MKALCIVDTCSLINWQEVELGKRTLYSWLRDEFEVQYSRAVWDEIRQHRHQIESRVIRRRGEDFVWEYSAISTCERALFTPFISRTVEAGICRQCGQTIWREQAFTPDLTDTRDRGERYNCCIALDIVRTGTYRQVVFLTDDRRAIQSYVTPVFETFPLGQIWTSLDFVLYLFMRHRSRIPLNEVMDVLRDVNAQAATGQESPKIARRLTIYQKKAQRIDCVLAQIQGGH